MKKRFSKWMLDFFFPPKCVLCRSLLSDEESDICTRCCADLPLFSAPARGGTYFSGFTAVFDYAGLVRESLHRYKFGGMQQYCVCYGKLMAASASAKLDGPFDLVTWTPVSRKRRRKRGYDQSELIAKTVALELRLPLAQTLCKTRDNPAQSSLTDADMRRGNVLGVYAPICPETVQNQRILLIDDIATTGATLEEASRVLLSAGAREICCAVLAAKP